MSRSCGTRHDHVARPLPRCARSPRPAVQLPGGLLPIRPSASRTRDRGIPIASLAVGDVVLPSDPGPARARRSRGRRRRRRRRVDDHRRVTGRRQGTRRRSRGHCAAGGSLRIRSTATGDADSRYAGAAAAGRARARSRVAGRTSSCISRSVIADLLRSPVQVAPRLDAGAPLDPSDGRAARRGSHAAMPAEAVELDVALARAIDQRDVLDVCAHAGAGSGLGRYPRTWRRDACRRRRAPAVQEAIDMTRVIDIGRPPPVPVSVDRTRIAIQRKVAGRGTRSAQSRRHRPAPTSPSSPGWSATRAMWSARSSCVLRATYRKMVQNLFWDRLHPRPVASVLVPLGDRPAS